MLTLLLKPHRLLPFILSLTLTVVWGLFGFNIISQFTGVADDEYSAQLDQLVDQVMKEDPQAAAQITRLRENRAVSKSGLIASLRVSQQEGGNSSIRNMLRDSANSVPAYVRLCSIGVDTNAFSNREEQTQFYEAHLTFLKTLESMNLDSISDDYVSLLESARKNPELWPQVMDDALALLVSEKVSDKSYRDFYLSHKGEDWIVDALMEAISQLPETDDRDTLMVDLLKQFLKAASDFHPNFKQAVESDELRPVAFELFSEYGQIIDQAVKLRKIPLKEIMEVLYLNRDFFDIQIKEQTKTPERIVEELALIKFGKPNVWRSSVSSASALLLNHRVPDKAERLLEKYTIDDVATFIFTAYENEIVEAANAIDKFGDMAIYVLNLYQDTTGFKEELCKDARIVPYMLKYGNAGLENLRQNAGWMDKYFDKNGIPKDKEWWVNLPGGGAIDVARNWTRGYPCEWSELGWAALDVAEAAALIASAGSSSVVTVTAKKGAGEAIGSIAKQTAKRTVLQATTIAAKNSIKGARKTILAQFSKNLLPSFLTRITKNLLQMRLVKVVTRNGITVWRVAYSASRIAATSVRTIFKHAKTVYQGWRSISPVTKKVIYRSILAVGVSVTLFFRTIPMLAEQIQANVETIKKIIDKVVEIAKDPAKLLEIDLSSRTLLFRYGLYLAILMSLSLATFRLRPGRRKIRYL